MNPVPFFNLQYIYNSIYLFLVGDYYSWFDGLLLWWRVLAYVLIPVLWGVIIYLIYQIVVLRQQQRAELKLMLLNRKLDMPVKNPHWEKIEKYLISENPAEWKLAIIEADVMLDEIVKTIHKSEGDSLGERLKNIEPSDFETLNEAWEAHKVRNRIAHEPQYELTSKELRDTMARYRAVFEEFNYL
jgi:hypothetical protein